MKNKKQLTRRIEKATNERELIKIWNQIAYNKYQYSLQELKELNEKIRVKVLKLDNSDEIPYLYMFLLSNCPKIK